MDLPFNRERETAAEPILRSRLLPRVSFRALLLVTTISAIAIAVVYAADQGGIYASAAAVGMFFALGMLICSALVFALSWAVSFLPRKTGAIFVGFGVFLAFSRFTGIPIGPAPFLVEWIWVIVFQVVGWYLMLVPMGSQETTLTESPFADDQLPPQIFAPREPNN